MVIKLLNAFDTIDNMEEAAEDEYDETGSDEVIPSVLIFLPGINEIEDLYGKLTDPIYRFV